MSDPIAWICPSCSVRRAGSSVLTLLSADSSVVILEAIVVDSDGGLSNSGERNKLTLFFFRSMSNSGDDNTRFLLWVLQTGVKDSVLIIEQFDALSNFV